MTGSTKKNRSQLRLRQVEKRGGYSMRTLHLRPQRVNQRDSTFRVGDGLTSVLRPSRVSRYFKSIEDSQSSIETSRTSGVRRSGLCRRSRKRKGEPISSLRRSASRRCSPEDVMDAESGEPGLPGAASAARLFMSHLALYAAHSRKDVSVTSICRRSAHLRRSRHPIGGPASKLRRSCLDLRSDKAPI